MTDYNHLDEDLYQLIDQHHNTEYPEIIHTDKWILASTLQKAIRRGEGDTALSACLSLYKVDKRMLLRRIAVTAFEDIGIGNTNLIKLIIHGLFGQPPHPLKKAKQIELLFVLISEMCKSPKERSGHYLYTICEEHPSLEHEREDFLYYSPRDLCDIVGDEGYSLAKRSLAAWYLGGTSRFRSPYLPNTPVEKDALWWIYEQMGTTHCLLEVIKQASKVMIDPFPLQFHLKHFETKNLPSGEVKAHTVPKTEKINRIPLYALDRHTRLGKAALRILFKNSPALQDYLTKWLPKPLWKKNYEMAVFRVESAVINKELMFPGYQELDQMYLEAEFLSSDRPQEYLDGLLQLVRDSIPELNKIRTRILMDQLGGL
ncbi:MAG: hypothetical protein JKX92_12545 [Porticoccaceae bacterium]|nr:hypothetical protein [Porticoccaceae bacterium]